MIGVLGAFGRTTAAASQATTTHVATKAKSMPADCASAILAMRSGNPAMFVLQEKCRAQGGGFHLIGVEPAAIGKPTGRPILGVAKPIKKMGRSSGAPQAGAPPPAKDDPTANEAIKKAPEQQAPPPDAQAMIAPPTSGGGGGGGVGQGPLPDVPPLTAGGGVTPTKATFSATAPDWVVVAGGVIAAAGLAWYLHKRKVF